MPCKVVPIQKLLSQIRWDRRFAGVDIEIGYLDRVAGRIERVPFHSVRIPEELTSVFELVDEAGLRRRIPLHRVREVHADGRLIWRRSPTQSP